MNKNNINWYKLDNAGKLFPSIATLRCTTVFRLSVSLKENVNPEILQLALSRLIKRMPYYQVNLKRGFFWYYLEKADNIPLVEKEKDYPCMYLDFLKSGYFPYRVLYFFTRISVEMSHFLTDGTGALIFLKSLIAEYLKLKGAVIPQRNGILDTEEIPDEKEYEDSFKKYNTGSSKKVMQPKPAMHFPFPLIERGKYFIVTGIMQADKAVELAKKHNVTLTVLFLTFYIETVLDFIKLSPQYLKNNMFKPVSMNVPVNLRSIFESKTMRNFFISISPFVNPDDETLDFDKILSLITEQMKIGVEKENLSGYIARNVKSEASIFIRILPLALKDALMPLVYLLFGENTYTSSISNLGKVTVPEPLDQYIDRFDFFPSPSRANKIKATMLSFKDKLYFTFGKLTGETVIERLFFTKLIKAGIKVKIETNIEQ